MLGFPLPSTDGLRLLGFQLLDFYFKRLPFWALFRLCRGFKIEGLGGVRALTSKKPRREFLTRVALVLISGFRGFGIGDSGWVCCVCVCDHYYYYYYYYYYYFYYYYNIYIYIYIFFFFLWGGG